MGARLMHGIVLKGLKDFVVDSYDRDTWRSLQEAAGVAGKIYVPVTEYPDGDVLALVEAASEATGIAAPELLREFGRYLIPPLLETYGVHVEQDWTGLELVANVETYIHEALRSKQLSTYTPPDLESEWVEDDRVLVTYTSDRELCDLAKGLLEGVGQYYGTPFSIEEESCMLEGADQCQILVSKAEVTSGNEGS